MNANTPGVIDFGTQLGLSDGAGGIAGQSSGYTGATLASCGQSGWIYKITAAAADNASALGYVDASARAYAEGVYVEQTGVTNATFTLTLATSDTFDLQGKTNGYSYQPSDCNGYPGVAVSVAMTNSNTGAASNWGPKDLCGTYTPPGTGFYG